MAAWEATAGQVEGTETPELPEPRRVRLTVLTTLSLRPAARRPAAGDGPSAPAPPDAEGERVDAVTENFDLFVDGFLTSLSICLVGTGRVAACSACSSRRAGSPRCRRCAGSARSG